MDNQRYRTQQAQTGSGMNEGTTFGAGMSIPFGSTVGTGATMGGTGISTGIGTGIGTSMLGSQSLYGGTTQQNMIVSQQKIGAHELIMTHEILTGTIDCINTFELYRPHIKDQRLSQIVDHQLQHMQSNYQSLVSFLQNRQGQPTSSYRTPIQSSPAYGLRNPAPQQPNSNINQVDDRDVASGLLSCTKSLAMKSTIAALECADPTLRQIISNCVQSCINQAYETFQYMNQKGMYQVPTLAANTTQTMMNTYQPTGSFAMQGTTQLQ
ncbi:spore coat protein [Heliorestis convoluta]|uniref:Spore coat protein n=1 Tax=Heliorestis convoluta TaxID=356322 RepID=A0A5Q2N263_9FIRM|nr:spore coat protein [Heliorestis convoluta]QGG47919.1 spore coat protein [Heliorestis convoluta]